MGQIAWISVFMFVVLPIDINDNRRHVHIFIKGNVIRSVLPSSGLNQMERNV